MQKVVLAFLFCFTTFTISGVAQDKEKDKLPLMPENSTLTDGQAWVVKYLPKYFGYSTVDDQVKISNVKFDGCTLSYRVLQRYTDQKSPVGDKPTLSATGARVATDIQYSVHEDVWIDLKQIDAAKVALDPLPKPKSMQVITLDTIGQKDLIKFDRQGTSVRYNATGNRNRTMLPVKENGGEALAKGIRSVIRMCQASN